MATTALLWQVLAVAVAAAHAQFDLPYPLQLVHGTPSAVSPQLYGPQPKAVTLIRGSTQGGGGQQQAPADEELTQFHSQDGLGRSLFGYMMADQARIEARAPDGSVRGSYTYLDPSGRAIKVQYWDEGQGFHAAGNHLPASFPGLPQPVRDTPEVEAARRQHLQAYQQVLRRQLELLYQQQQQQDHQQASQPAAGDSEEVVVESDPLAPPADYADEESGVRYPSLPLVAALYDPSHVHDVGRDAVIVDSAVGRHGHQGSTTGDRQNSGDSSKTLVDAGGDILGHGAHSGQRFVIVYAENAAGDNTINENDDEKPSAKHVRSTLQNSNTSDSAAQQNHTKTATRRARRGRVTIYDYIKERDPERMARNFPESYLIQEIFNSTRGNTHVDDDTDDLQRAAEREFQFLHKIGGAKNRGRSMLAADVVTSDSGSRRRTFYKAGVVLPDLTYPTRHSGGLETPGLGSDAVLHGGEPTPQRGFVSYNENKGTSRPQFTYDENRRSDNTRKGSPTLSHRYDSHPLIFTEGDISHNYSVFSVNTALKDTPHPVYYPEYTNSYLNQTHADEYDDEAGRADVHRGQSSLPGSSPIVLPQEGNIGAYDMRDIQDPYNHQELPLDTYFRPQERSRSRYEPNPVYYKGITYSDNSETQVTSDSSFNTTDNGGVGGQYQLHDDSSVAPSYFGSQLASNGRSNEKAQARNFNPEGRTPVFGGDVVYSPPHSKYGALFYKIDSNDNGSRDYSAVSSASSQTYTQPHVSGGYSSTVHRDHHVGHPAGVTNVGGYPPVAMQYLQDIARRADGPNYSHGGTKEAVVLNNLIGRSASSKARSLEAPATVVAEGGKVVGPESRTGASKEELVAEAVAAGSSKDEHSTADGTKAGEATSTAAGSQQSVVSLKDGPAESYSAMYLYPQRQAKEASPEAAAMPRPQVDGGFFYSFHHPVIPVAVQVAQPAAADATDADADAKAPPRGLSVSQRASLYDAVPVAAVHDAQVPPYLRGAVTDHQTKPIFIHYDPAEAARAS